MHQAPYARGYFVGDYQGLDAQGTAFRPLFTLASPGSDTVFPNPNPDRHLHQLPRPRRKQPFNNPRALPAWRAFSLGALAIGRPTEVGAVAVRDQ
jgi:hypothetical protein